MRTAAMLLAIALMVVAAPAAAHTASSPMTARITVMPIGVFAELSYMVPAGDEARELREQFDRDTDGKLDADEQKAIADFLSARASKAFVLRIDGIDTAMGVGEPKLQVSGGASGSLLLTVTLTKQRKLPEGQTRFEVGVELADASAVTPVVVTVKRWKGIALLVDSTGGDASRGVPVQFTVTRR